MENKTKTRIALYMRADKDEQGVPFCNLTFQEEQLLKFINSQHDVILDDSHIYKDNNLSGTLPVESRPALKKLFEDGAQGEFDIVYAYKVDRFFQQTSLFIKAIDTLSTSHIIFKSITEPFDMSQNTGRFMITLFGAIAEMEAKKKKQVSN